jgi:arylsulfatase A-like enzyme
MDTLRADRLGFMGCDTCRTPHLDAIAALSLYFTSAYTNAWFTTPSHMTVFTSLFPATHKVESRSIKIDWNTDEKTDGEAHVLDPRYKTLAEVLHANGFRTYYFGPQRSKYFMKAEGFGRGFDHFQDTAFRRGIRYGSYQETDFDTASLAPLSQPGRKFLFLHSYITHSPFSLAKEDDRGKEHRRLPYGKELLADVATIIKNDPDFLLNELDNITQADRKNSSKCTNPDDLMTCFHAYSSDVYWHAAGQYQRNRAHKKILEDFQPDIADKETRRYRLAYDRGVEQLDAQIGEFWAELERMQALSNTIVIFFSDHGEELLEHGGTNHTSFHEHTARVPLMIYHPALAQARRSTRLVSLVDVMPTILSMAGVPIPKQCQGKPLWEQKSPYVFGYTLGEKFVRDKNWKLMHDYMGHEELFYSPLDPDEHQNLLALKNPWVKAEYTKLRQARDKWELEQSL